ncbi:MAG: hypothetical protein MZU84_01440 [Sphingobacterium sp.]|nr:hypothetical protein [Sphingobacterium sp.]
MVKAKHAKRHKKCECEQLICLIIYFLSSFTASTSFGSTFMASPTMPYWAASKIGASLSVLTGHDIF